MIDIGKLYCGGISTADGLRYGTASTPDSHGNSPHARAVSAAERRPIVVWNVTRRCNLSCVHCYTDSHDMKYDGELTTDEGLSLIDSLASFRIPSLLFSGGEPLTRPDLFTLIEHASSRGIRPVISTNGTLIDRDTAKRIRSAGVTYAGISLDGTERTNDLFRGVPGAFDAAIRAFDYCAEAGQRTGLRLTLTKVNVRDLHQIFDMIESRGIQRACFYHLVPSGRGRTLSSEELSHRESRQALDIIIDRTADLHRRGKKVNILTVDNHADGVYLYLKLLKENPDRAEDVHSLLSWNGGGAHSTGVGIANIDFNGNVHPDQFWQDCSFGTIRQRSFADIWTDESEPLMKGLKHKKEYLKGRCRVCRYTDLCTGAMRVRAFRHFGDPWAPDPQCYLTDEEIGLDSAGIEELKRAGEYFLMPEDL